MRILIKGGRVLDPAGSVDAEMDVLIEERMIVKKGSNLTDEADEIIDASGKWVCPGFIDVHVHFRDPGYEYKEDIETGLKAAAAGGFTTVCCMPNTSPVTDNRQTVSYIIEKAKSCSKINLLPIGSITKGQKGQELTDIAKMKKAGACGISEDGYTVTCSQLLKEALIICNDLGMTLFSHCEDISLVNGGVINEGIASLKFGLPGISNASEEVIVSRDMIIANEAGAKIHLCHMSTQGSVDLIREAKARGQNVTAEAAPHHFTLCDEDIIKDDANYKMNPPIRSRKDRDAIIEGLKDGTIDVIATDHAPHHEEEKNKGFALGANGITGLETSLALTITNLVKPGILSPLSMVEKMSLNPAKVLGIDKGSLAEGKVADITIIDPDTQYVIDASAFYSKGKNTPFNGYKVAGKAVYTIAAGQIVMKNGLVIGG